MNAPQLKPVALFPASLKDRCPRCHERMSVTPCEDFVILASACGYACTEQSGEMKAEFKAREVKRTARERNQ